eukprot:symbB.v1.2.005876.t2/scaffold345.1/size224439/1
MPQMLRHSSGLREESRPAGDLLSTIKLPKNAVDLSGCLPKPRYVADASGVVEEELIPPGPAVDTESRPDARPVEAARPLPAAAVAHQPPAPRGDEIRRHKVSPVLSDGQSQSSRPPMPPRIPRERHPPSTEAMPFEAKVLHWLVGISECCGVKLRKSDEPQPCQLPSQPTDVVPEAESIPSDPATLKIEIQKLAPESPRRLDRRGNPILPRELSPSGAAPHHVTFADDEGHPVEEVVQVLKRQASASDRLATGWKAIQSSFGCGKISRESR